MSLAKDRYYWTQLRFALTSGQWSSKYPAKAPNGTVLPWSELFRKFNKHCRGFQDVAEVASQTYALALLLGANSRDDDQDDEGEGVYPLELGQECVLPEERIEEAKAGYNVLKGLKSSNFDTLNFALAYYAYALGNPSECLSHLSSIPDMVNLRNHIPSESDASARLSVASGHTHHLGIHVPSFSTASSVASTGGSLASLADSSLPEIKDGRAWALTESLRSTCLQGMSHEKLAPNDPQAALKAYGTSVPLLSMLEAVLTDHHILTSPASNTKAFLQHRELWRWVERLLWRAIIVSARIADDGSGLHEMGVWPWLRQYSTWSRFWPATFRTAHRSTVSVLYLRAFILRHHPVHADSTSGTREKGQVWLPTARTVVKDYRAILSASTKFPHAGERNVRVEDFVDLCMGVWEAGGLGGEGAGWVLDVLWWATRLTFNSHRVLRHMTRLLHASGDTALARRTLLLYVQVVGKAYEASRIDAGSNNSSTRDLNDGQVDEDEDADWDSDSDRAWVETLVAGARMLCRFSAAQPGLEGLREAREAGMCIEKARERLRTDGEDGAKLGARVDLAEGVWNVIMTLKEQDPHSRPARLASAHALFERACAPPSVSHQSESAFVPDPAAFYHLALSFAQPGPTHDLEQAILHAGRAVEGDAQEIRYWHLLGLLLAAAEKWSEAREILERGAEIEEDISTEDGGTDDGDGTEGHTATDTHTLRVPGQSGIDGAGEVREKDFVGKKGKAVNREEDGNMSSGSLDMPSVGNGHANGIESSKATSSKRIPILDGTRIPSAAALLAPAQDHPPSSKLELFEHALQLRMTQGVLTEVIEGAEGAEEKWLEVFSWVAERRAAEAEAGKATPRPSMDGTRPPTEKAPSFVISPPLGATLPPPPEVQEPASGISPVEFNEKQETLQSTSIPITVSPATPDSEHQPRARGKRHGATGKRSSSMDRDTSKSKKVQQMLKNRVHKGQVRITTISRKIGSGVVRTGSLKRSNSTPDFHAILRQTSYQASSIHSRRRVSSILHHPHDHTPADSPPPPPTPVPPPPSPQGMKRNSRTARSIRLIATLWLMSAATFRRLGKIEQARGAIQEAEVRDEGNPGVWVQLALYYVALGQQQRAMDALQKALFIDPDDVSASVHLAGLYLKLHEAETDKSSTHASSANVDIAAGMLGHLTRGNGWDVPEAWYYLAKAYGLQGRRKRERECLDFALALSTSRGIRELGAAVGCCI
ncbi:hypothetical protein D9615_008660 [Tricholomella constricta]|uniref:TPR-like protein n=1 Tax=Tricholomella constricta TaxID=117010 RepID=A0A8H5H4E9_9AGAR|nr:hypothetical protein D9615_008660 [Tricholomella constricta]